MNLVLFFYFFLGRTLHMNCSYVTSSLRSCGISFLVMNVIVLVRFLIRLLNPFASRLNSFDEDVLQFVLIFF